MSEVSRYIILCIDLDDDTRGDIELMVIGYMKYFLNKYKLLFERSRLSPVRGPKVEASAPR